MKTSYPAILAPLIALILATVTPGQLPAQGTSFTYQGRLGVSGNAAAGNYDMKFSLYDLSTGGSIVGGPLTNNAVGVTNGLFAVVLDFGPGVFPGANRWLEIGVRTNGTGAFTTLTTRQQVTAAPYAITAGNLSGPLPATQLSGTLASAQFSGTYGGVLTLSNAGNNISGNGSGLTAVNAATLSGLTATAFWKTTGNAGTGSPPNFLGTTDNQPFEIRVNNTRALRIEYASDLTWGTSPNLIGGSGLNFVSNGVVGATIAGGGTLGNTNKIGANFATISGGRGNEASGDTATIGGGKWNIANGHIATVGGGVSHVASGTYSTIAGGVGNKASGDSATVGAGIGNEASGMLSLVSGGGGFFTGNVASGNYATVSGGQSNQAAGAWAVVTGGATNSASADYAVVVGGLQNSASGVNSIAMGRSASASGEAGIAIGVNTHANGLNSVAMGLSTTATGWGATALGYNTTATGTFSTALGNIATADGYSAIAAGELTYAGGHDSVAMGNHTTATGDGSTAMGISTRATNTAATALGFYTQANGPRSIACGQYSTASGDTSTAFGAFTTAAGDVSTAMGYSSTATDHAFAAGYNAQATNRGAFVWSDSTGTVTGSTNNNSVTFRASGGYRFFSNTGNSGIQLAPGGTAWATISDRNMKKDFASVDSQLILEKLAALPITQWHYRWENNTTTPHIGPMAQDFKAAFYPGADDKTITTQEADGVALAAIQGLNQKLEATREELQRREAENVALRKRLEKIERLLAAKSEAE